MFKRIFTLLFCLFLVFNCSAFTVFANGDSPDGVPVGYSPAGLNDQVDAFRAYCKSRNLFVEGSALDTITDVTTSIYQHLVADAGLDINELQNQIYKKTSGNVGAQWFFTQTGISAYNRLFAELLQNNDLAVGDTVDNKNIFNGEKFIDDDGNSCLVYIIHNRTNTQSGSFLKADCIGQYGSYLKYTGDTLSSMLNVNEYFNAEFHIYGRTYIGNLTQAGKNSNGLGYSKVIKTFNNQTNIEVVTTYDAYWVINSTNTPINGGTVVYKLDDGNYYIGTLADGLLNSSYSSTYAKVKGIKINLTPPADTETSSSVTTQNVYYTTNNQTINNNNYEGDTYITNEGDVITNNPDPTPTPGGQDPGWNVGGGQGSYNDGQGNNYTINFPDFELPDLNIDWSIQGLGNKFPFSIPFDIASLISVLNAEPEAPRFQGTVNFGFTTWDYDINLQQFDTVAQVCRIAELLLLVFGLILITRSIIKG